jgi:hypothetical protein
MGTRLLLLLPRATLSAVCSPGLVDCWTVLVFACSSPPLDCLLARPHGTRAAAARGGVRR